MNSILRVHGMSRNPDTKDYIMVHQYAEGGSLNDMINKNHENIGWRKRMEILECTIEEIHKRQMVHRDLHPGNILLANGSIDNDSKFNVIIFISDMGLCERLGNVNETNIYGCLPYIAPEVLRGKPYTQAADIYSFGMIMYFVATGRQPFDGLKHDERLALDICRGIRPEINELEAPKYYIELMKRCWDSNPDDRPKNATEVDIMNWSFNNFECEEEYRQTNISSIKNEQSIIRTQVYTNDLPKYINSNSECYDCVIP